MTAYQLSLAALIVLLFPMIYFQFASLTFFLARLQDPVVTRMLRGLFSTAFLGVAILGTVAAIAFAGAGRMAVAVALGLVATSAAAARRWFLQRLDAHVRARDAGDGASIRRLRQLHLGGIAYNAVQLGGLILGIPAVFPGA